MADRMGQQFGNYRLIRLLGRGGFAEVYLGQHMRLNMQAAIKVLHAQQKSSYQASLRCQRIGLEHSRQPNYHPQQT